MNSLLAIALVLTLYSAVDAQFGVGQRSVGGINQNSQIIGDEFFDKGVAGSGKNALQQGTKLAAGDRKQEGIQAFDRVKGSANSGKRAGKKARLGAYNRGKGQVIGDRAKFHNANVALSDKVQKKEALSYQNAIDSDQAFRINANEGFKDNNAFQVFEDAGLDAAAQDHFGFYDNLGLNVDSGLGAQFGAESFLNGQEQFNKFGEEEIHAKSAGKGQLSLADQIFGGSDDFINFKRK